MPGRMGKQVTILVVLTQSVRAGIIVFLTVFAFAVNTPVEVTEGNRPIHGNGILNGIDVIVDGFVHALDSTGNQHITAHEPCVMDAALIAQLLDQLAGLFLRQKTAGLDSVDQQL